MKTPVLTVVMPVYNGEAYLREAIDSVLTQTFTDYEFIIINDGSIDQSMDIILSYSDERIRIVNNLKNYGIAHCRNLGLELAMGIYLAWTDCDDLNMPTRFEEQIDFLRMNEDYGGCGTWIERFKGTKVYEPNKALADADEIKAALLFRPAAVPNATAMLRISEIKTQNLWYNTALPISEDYDFIFRCARLLKFSNLQRVLYQYRDSETSIMKKFKNLDQKIYEINMTIYSLAFKELEIKASMIDFYTHHMLCSDRIFDNYVDYIACYTWMGKIKLANVSKNIYSEKALDIILGQQFFFVSKKASKFGLKTWIFFVRKSRVNNWRLHIAKLLKLGIRCLLKHDKFEFRGR